LTALIPQDEFNPTRRCTVKQAWLSLLIILLIPVFLFALLIIHELGHTTAARLLGDPGAVFYLADKTEQSSCIGCTYYDVSKLSSGANLIVSLAGLFAGQLVAVTALFLLQLRQAGNRWLRLFLSITALSFAFSDVPWQVLQALSANLGRSLWPTGADLVDFLLLLQMRFDLHPLLLKVSLLLVAGLYLAGFVWLYGRNRAAQMLSNPSIETTGF
jgi:hypothetical protein